MFLIVHDFAESAKKAAHHAIQRMNHTASKYANDPCKKEMVASNNFRKHGIRNLSSKSSIDKGLLNALSDATHRGKKWLRLVRHIAGRRED